LKYCTNGFGAVNEINALGIKLAPGPSFGGPPSIFQELGASTAKTGTFVVSKASMTLGNGSRTSPEKEKPKMASTTRSEFARAAWKSLVKGIDRLVSWRCRRLKRSDFEGFG
jgi:hypothetical protein